MDSDFEVEHLSKQVRMKIVKPLELLFLDPFSESGDEKVELDVRVFKNDTEIKNDSLSDRR